MQTTFAGPGGHGERPVACVPNELVVDEQHLDQALAALRRGGAVARPRPGAGTGVTLLALDPSTCGPVPDVVRALRRRHPHLRIAPNYLLRGASHMHMVATRHPEPAAPLAALPTGDGLPGHGVTVGVVDSGFCPHAWFGDRVDARPEDLEGPPASAGGVLPFTTGHGTFVAGIVLRHAPGARIVARRVVDDDGHVSDTSLAAVLDSMEGVDVLNLSLGTTAVDRHDAVGLLATANSLFKLWRRKPQLVVVAPAGNDGDDVEFWPARFDPVVAVAALDAAGTGRASFSNYGDWVDACARGEQVHSRFLEWDGDVEAPPLNEHGRGRRVRSGPFSGWATWDGTSFATARVTGAIAAAMDASAGVDGPAAVGRVLGGPAPFPGLGAVVDPPVVAR